MSNIDQTRLNVQFLLPLNEIVTNFYDELKSITSGYASFDYEDAGYQQSSLVKLGEKSEQGTLNSVCCNYDVVRCSAERESCPGAKHDLPREQGEGPRQGRGVQAEE